MAEALTPCAADRRLAALAAAFLPEPGAALSRLSEASAWLRSEAGRLARAPRAERLLTLQRALAGAPPSAEALAQAFSDERGALTALLREAAARRPASLASHPLVRLCREKFLLPWSAP